VAFSGSWRINVEVAAKTGGAGRRVRVSGGVDDQDTIIRLYPGESFTTPESHGLFSRLGAEGVRQGLHHFQRSVLARDLSPRTRPVIYNSWYATEFDVRTDHQIALAHRAADLGAEAFVVDDGWMPRRTTDTAGLGDWWADPARFPDGLHPIAQAVLQRGMRFGLWVEPEMVTPDSEVYRARPEWVYRAGDRPLTYLRHQLVLDFGRPEVTDWASQALRTLLRTYPISYLKWDLNRPITDGGRPGDPHGGEWALQHAQGVHRVLRMLREEFPEVTVEACASGGGRIDHSMLAASDVVWPSDETGPRDRLVIQDGFLSAYPAHIMSSWVTAMQGTDDRSPVSFTYRFVVAMAGVLGIGADITAWTPGQLEHAQGLIGLYKDIRSVVHTGQVGTHGRPGQSAYALEYAHAPSQPDRVVLLVYDADRDRRDREVRIRPHHVRLDGRYQVRYSGEIISGASAVATGLVVPFRLGSDCDVLILDRVG
jgi:alpha-galactosidase